MLWQGEILYPGEPEEIVLHDRVLQILGAIWLLMLSASVYGS